jgi:hypothetical protein
MPIPPAGSLCPEKGGRVWPPTLYRLLKLFAMIIYKFVVVSPGTMHQNNSVEQFVVFADVGVFFCLL